ncbi:MAG: hypothetical protein ACJ72F_10630 [Nitrososphaeraceae archaeon]
MSKEDRIPMRLRVYSNSVSVPKNIKYSKREDISRISGTPLFERFSEERNRCEGTQSNFPMLPK